MKTDTHAQSSHSPPKKKASMRARLVLFLGVLIIASVPIIMHGCAGFGGSPSGERLSRMRASPQWEDCGFANPQPIINHNKL